MVYDCFTFFNELDLLEIRLNVLKDVVDKFVLCEATFTHQGKPKPLHYEENKARFAAFHDKIIHIVVDNPPANPDGSSWLLENYQRNALARGLEQCTPHDVVMVSDLDEIPTPDMVTKYKDVKGIKIFRQRAFYYFINCINATNDGSYRWNGTTMANYNKAISPQDLRNVSIDYLNVMNTSGLVKVYCWIRLFFKKLNKWDKVIIVNDGGWHFSFLGGVEKIISKVEAFAHVEYNKDAFKSAESIEKAIENGEDIFGRDFRYKFVPLDKNFPKYLLDNKAKYEKLIKEVKG